ncbi:MAG: LysR family transcriptional regulator [Anaerolineales bacterium]|nr:LysR family transcriptional regulator [Chloroflexota bacterium]MBL6979934.1 LysR family transcriptional regulator [Anaerolineales bacterium]
MLSIDDLVVFVEAADCNNFSKAGRKLHLTQPAVSQKIGGLEDRFGVKLFNRQGRSMCLTEAGQVLEPLAKEVIGLSRRLDETMVSLQGEVVGEMTVGCSTASGKYLLPGQIALFRQQFPMVRINVEVTSRRSVLDKLSVGDVALGVSSKKIEGRDLEYKELFTDDVILIVPEDHPWADYPQIYPDDLLDEPIILREEAAGTREVFLESLRNHDIYPEMLNVAMELGNAEAIEMAVEEGIGIAFISRLAATRGLELGNIAEVRVAGMDLKRTIFMVRNQNVAPTRAQLNFWDFVSTPEAQDRLPSVPMVREEI